MYSKAKLFFFDGKMLQHQKVSATKRLRAESSGWHDVNTKKLKNRVNKYSHQCNTEGVVSNFFCDEIFYSKVSGGSIRFVIGDSPVNGGSTRDFTRSFTVVVFKQDFTSIILDGWHTIITHLRQWEVTFLFLQDVHPQAISRIYSRLSSDIDGLKKKKKSCAPKVGFYPIIFM